MLKTLNVRLPLLLLAINITASSVASNKACMFSKCLPTPKSIVYDQPGHYPTYNDLSRKEGELDNEYSKTIILRGNIVDKGCVPVTDANIKIWQKDEYGDYRYIVNSELPYKVYNMNYKMYRDVQGAGQTYSSNDGTFAFVTMPPSEEIKKRGNNNDYISISIQHLDLPPYKGRILLNKNTSSKQKNRHKQYIVAALNEFDSACYGVEVYDFNIVLDGHNKYRRY